MSWVCIAFSLPSGEMSFVLIFSALLQSLVHSPLLRLCCCCCCCCCFLLFTSKIDCCWCWCCLMANKNLISSFSNGSSMLNALPDRMTEPYGILNSLDVSWSIWRTMVQLDTSVSTFKLQFSITTLSPSTEQSLKSSELVCFRFTLPFSRSTCIESHDKSFSFSFITTWDADSVNESRLR